MVADLLRFSIRELRQSKKISEVKTEILLNSFTLK
jgi:hypothetical protein